MTTRVRFAPSPTGYLHIGGVRTALFNWLWARKTAGVFVLRIEDTDQARSTADSLDVIVDSMRWLGLDWDEGPGVGGAHGPYTQMERLPIYRQHAEELIRAHKAYRCYCTKEELEAQRAALKARDAKAPFRYPGTCRNRRDQPHLPYVIRFAVPEEGSVRYVDKVFGEVSTPNAAQQDFVILRSDGVPLYNFAAVVDDMTMDISLVVRGRDHMVNTPPQVLLYEAFQAALPAFAHLPMMLAANGEKLSKRHAAVSVSEYREQGYAPHAVLNYLARFGWSHGDQEVFSLEDLVAAFDWEHCNKSDGKFDPKKFLAINHEHLKTQKLMPTDEYAQRLAPFVEKRGLGPIGHDRLKEVIPMIRERATTFVDAADRLDFVFREPPAVDAAAAAQFLVPANAPHLRELARVIESVGTWSVLAVEEAVGSWLSDRGLRIKDVAQPARVAVTGKSASPGLFEVIVALGRPTVLTRLRAGADASERV